MKLFKTNDLISVINVADYETALAWYQTWLGEPDEVPMESTAEWRIADHAWLQLTGAEAGGKAAVVIGVDDVAACREALIRAGIEAGEIVDWEVVLACDVADPEGNGISFVQLKE
ncbi:MULTISPECIES: VOC family protein [unclassified Neisseria]|uniref:VOC family protein n=1 Tax=unclassified Neisseria TaxID=2623750 RepID=UPI00266518FB|nr:MULTISPECIES: VOC family protein [unclassified Neisseria]MDO1508856.1 VOC family protein [Neisseria sp. MVDL19-042950]MDO1515115.1 VOC family protein [Neisseria sp. MVDL18-041461]MDO1562475.1 VOC family protein [Neisseria sp. MVDL20-010259]